MPSFKVSSFCLVVAASLATHNANAFHVAPPLPATTIEVPIAASTVIDNVQTSSSNLPSQRELLEKVGSSITLASSIPATTDTPSKPSAIAATDTSKKPNAVAATDTSKKPTVVAATDTSKKPNVVALKPGINIADINFDGVVPKTEADEYVVISNGSKDAVDVSGYFIYPASTGTQGSTFTFPKGSVIKPNSSVRVYTNEIHKETGGYSWKSGKALWSNNGGLGVLKDAKSKKLGEFSYKPGK